MRAHSCFHWALCVTGSMFWPACIQEEDASCFWRCQQAGRFVPDVDAARAGLQSGCAADQPGECATKIGPIHNSIMEPNAARTDWALQPGRYHQLD